MSRPSLKRQRTEEILEAYMTCVARYGLEGATQERIAAEAGVKRPLLRNYLGNRDQMITALNGHVAGFFDALTAQLELVLSNTETTGELIDILFDKDQKVDSRLMLAWQALSASASDYPGLTANLLSSLSRFVGVLQATLQRLSPRADPNRVRAVAQGISASFQGLDAISQLSPPASWHAELKLSATLLVSTLETTE